MNKYTIQNHSVILFLVQVAQKINYARNLYDEQIQTLTESRESDDLD